MSKLAKPYYLDERQNLRFKYHDGQRQVMDSRRRFILMLSGTQSGKTILAPWWLFREICREGPGDYLAVSPTYKLMQLKLLPEFLKLFEQRLQLGTYHKADRIFQFSPRGQEVAFGSIGEPTTVFFGHAQDPESLESATAKAAVLDEAGQRKFKIGSWEAIQRRLSIHQGRVLLPTTPYTLGWLKSELYDRYQDGARDIDVINFPSTLNPAFPEEEYIRQKSRLPAWKFNMMYRGEFERPAGMIYDCFDRDIHLTPDFSIGEDWPRYLGLDFGGVNTAGIFLAREPDTKRYVAYREYKKGGRTAEQHARSLLRDEPKQPRTTGGSWSEDQWRDEFASGGLPVRKPPVKDVEVGIDRVYSLLKLHPELEGDGSQPYLEIMESCKGLIDEMESYSRVLDDNDEPTEKIEDKAMYHRLDALRYVATDVVGKTWEPGVASVHF